MVRVILVGCGNMGYAMLAGWLSSKRLAPADTLVVEPDADLRRRAAALGVAAVAGPGDLGADLSPQLVVLAVKPQVIGEVAAGYVRFGGGSTTFLSVAAGTGISALEAVLGQDTPIARCMPNTPASIGKGMMVFHAPPLVSQAAKAFIASLLEASGEVATIDSEELMDAVTAVSGSGPAYVFHFIECLTAAAEEVGLPPATASLLARQTVFGAASLAAESGEDPALLRRQVTSPNGTTAAALEVLMGGDGLKRLVSKAVEAARARSVELGKGVG
jgi:pyrroline-5-carboxylate reductase